MAGNTRHLLRLLFIGILMVMINSASVPLGTNGEADKERVECYATVTTKKGVNVRARPTSDSTKFGELKYKAQTYVYDTVVGESVQGNNKWYKIKYQSKYAFITARYSSFACSLKTEPEQNQDQDKSSLSKLNTDNLASASASASTSESQEPLA